MRATLALAVLSSVVTTLCAQGGIRLVAVPSPLVLPAPGATLLLDVEVVADSPPDEVWLATDAAAVDRVPLTPSGKDRFQRNLADAVVANLLPAGRDQGSFFVFVRRGKLVTQSAAIGWTRATAGDAKLRCVVRSRGAATRTVATDKPSWLDVEAFERIELQGAASRQSTAVARIDDVELPLVRRADDGLWVLDADARLRERMHAAVAFEIEVRQGGTSTLFAFQCVPAVLRVEPEKTVFDVPQRRRAVVPGSNGWLEVRIDDITMGRVQFELVDAEGAPIVASRPVRERDRVDFALAKQRYVLVVKRLVNSLVGEDHAEFAIEPAEGLQPDLIGELLRAVEASEDTFLREGKEYAGVLAAQFLLGKVRTQEREPTVDAFIDELASKSSRTGEAYRVRRKDGTEITMREWLVAERKKLESARRPPK